MDRFSQKMRLACLYEECGYKTWHGRPHGWRH